MPSSCLHNKHKHVGPCLTSTVNHSDYSVKNVHKECVNSSPQIRYLLTLVSFCETQKGMLGRTTVYEANVTETVVPPSISFSVPQKKVIMRVSK